MSTFLNLMCKPELKCVLFRKLECNNLRTFRVLQLVWEWDRVYHHFRDKYEVWTVNITSCDKFR